MKERIKLVRKTEKLTMQEFAASIGSTSASVSRYESGERIPSNSVLMMISEKFGVRLEWLKTGEGEMYQIRDIDDTEGKLLNCYQRLPDRLKAMVRVLAEMDPEWYIKLDEAFEALEKRHRT